MFFQPYRTYIITRQIYNERDFGQVYVKAWVRDANTDEALLDGVEMSEASDEKGRFKYSYKMPADPSGNGRQLRVITVVYSDSGYTTRDVNYQVEETDVVVRDMNVMGHSGGGGADVDYKKVREIVSEEIAKIPPIPKLDISDIKKELKDAKNAISGLISDIPEVNLTAIELKISSLFELLKKSEEKEKSFDHKGMEKTVKGLVDEIERLKKDIEIIRNKTLIKSEISNLLATREVKLNLVVEGKDNEKIDILAEDMKSVKKTSNDALKASKNIEADTLEILDKLDEN